MPSCFLLAFFETLLLLLLNNSILLECRLFSTLCPASRRSNSLSIDGDDLFDGILMTFLLVKDLWLEYKLDEYFKYLKNSNKNLQ